MAGKGKNRDGGNIIILKRIEGGGGGHHGGAWKVAYADFVTAMMAFFLLMWLLNATTEEQRRGLADYFAPTNVMGRAQTGTGLPFGGRTPNSAGAMASDAGLLRVERGPAPVRLDLDEEEDTEPQPARPATEPPQAAMRAASGGGRALVQAPVPASGSLAPTLALTLAPPPAAPHPAAPAQPPQPEAALRAELARREQVAFEQAAQELRALVQEDRGLAELARQLVVEQVPEGLRIQLLDADRLPMFALGGSTPNDRARGLLQKVAQVAARLPNGIAIAGHTDATPFRGAERSNWDLSAERAIAVRRLLADAGIAEARIRSVSGHAEREPLLPQDPAAAANRRVAITLLRDAPAPTQEGAAR